MRLYYLTSLLFLVVNNHSLYSQVSVVKVAISNAIESNILVGGYFYAELPEKKCVTHKDVEKACKGKYRFRNVQEKEQPVFGVMKKCIISFEFRSLSIVDEDQVLVQSNEGNAKGNSRETEIDIVNTKSKETDKKVVEVVSGEPKDILPDPRLKGNWLNTIDSTILIIQECGDAWIIFKDGSYKEHLWRSNSIVNDAVSFYEYRWPRIDYFRGFSKINFYTDDTIDVKESHSNENIRFIRIETDYKYETDDAVENWKGINYFPDLVNNVWHGKNGLFTMFFSKDSSLIFRDRFGKETISRWSTKKEYSSEIRKGKSVLEISIPNCFDDAEDFWFYNDPYTDDTHLNFSNSKGRTSRKPLSRFIPESEYVLSSEQREKIKGYLLGFWNSRYNTKTPFKNNSGILLKSDWTYETKIYSPTGFIVSDLSLGGKGTWSFYYKEYNGKKYIFLDLLEDRSMHKYSSIHSKINRIVINIESFTDSEFVGWRTGNSERNQMVNFKRIQSFNEIYDSGDMKDALVILFGIVVMKSIIDGVSEDDVISTYGDKSVSNYDIFLREYRIDEDKRRQY